MMIIIVVENTSTCGKIQEQEADASEWPTSPRGGGGGGCGWGGGGGGGVVGCGGGGGGGCYVTSAWIGG